MRYKVAKVGPVKAGDELHVKEQFPGYGGRSSGDSLVYSDWKVVDILEKQFDKESGFFMLWLLVETMY